MQANNYQGGADIMSVCTNMLRNMVTPQAIVLGEQAMINICLD